MEKPRLGPTFHECGIWRADVLDRIPLYRDDAHLTDVAAAFHSYAVEVDLKAAINKYGLPAHSSHRRSRGAPLRGMPTNPYEYEYGWTPPTPLRQLPHDCEVGTGLRICHA
ncbi:hypothetical protein ACFVYE_03535 [Streptomyces sp. NPDC058239]|uniref:hypothetical protein n=1 Tax=Streptomyces sp. NPDC058239 TaxID=3346395 RepID=UPI0036EDB499